MFKKLLLAAASVVAFGGSASAETKDYTFDGFCDGLHLVEVNGIATGKHIGSSDCASQGAQAGGLYVAKSGTGKVWIIATTEGLTDTVLYLVLDQQSLTYTGYIEAGKTQAFKETVSGTLDKGRPDVSRHPLKSLGWKFNNAKN